jgi:cation:H+ antiporter
VSPGIIGATVAAFATSSPELSVAISSASEGHPEISLGDVLGSNVVNIALILALALIVAPIQCVRDNIKREFPVALFAPIILGLLALDGRLDRADGLVLFILFTAWMAFVIRDARRQRDATGDVLGRRPALLTAVSSLGGLLCLFVGGRLIVIGAEGVAHVFGIPEFVIGATVVALGTSVPELATVLISQLRGHKEVSLGVILGSNIFNGLFIIFVAAAICPISTAGRAPLLSLLAGLAVVAITYPFGDAVLGRLRGVLLLLTYVAYVLLVVQR